MILKAPHATLQTERGNFENTLGTRRYAAIAPSICGKVGRAALPAQPFRPIFHKNVSCRSPCRFRRLPRIAASYKSPRA